MVADISTTYKYKQVNIKLKIMGSWKKMELHNNKKNNNHCFHCHHYHLKYYITILLLNLLVLRQAEFPHCYCSERRELFYDELSITSTYNYYYQQYYYFFKTVQWKENHVMITVENTYWIVEVYKKRKMFFTSLHQSILGGTLHSVLSTIWGCRPPTQFFSIWTSSWWITQCK